MGLSYEPHNKSWKYVKTAINDLNYTSVRKASEMYASAQYMTYTSINLWITHSTCSYNPFTLIHSMLSVWGPWWLWHYSAMWDPIGWLHCALLWCRAFHYTGQLELLGNACGKAGGDVRWNRWTIMKIGTFGAWGKRAQRSPWISVGVFFPSGRHPNAEKHMTSSTVGVILML